MKVYEYSSQNWHLIQSYCRSLLSTKKYLGYQSSKRLFIFVIRGLQEKRFSEHDLGAAANSILYTWNLPEHVQEWNDVEFKEALFSYSDKIDLSKYQVDDPGLPDLDKKIAGMNLQDNLHKLQEFYRRQTDK